MSPLRTLGPYSEDILVSTRSIHTVKKAYQRAPEPSNFSEGKNKVDVAITLDIDADQVFYIYEDYLRLLSLYRLTTMYRELGNDDIDLLYYLYTQLKWEGLVTKKGIHRIVGAAGELRNHDQALIETASDIGRLNFYKSNLERDLDDLTIRIDNYGAMLLERSKQARQFKGAVKG